MAITGSQIITKAKSFLNESGTRFWKDYGCPTGWAWCVIFVWDIFRLCGASNLFYDGKKVAGCGLEKTWCDKNLTKVSLANAKEGDIVIFSWKKGEISHTGFAIKPLSSTVLQTIEGNTNGGKVAIRQRSSANILGIYRPKWPVEKKTTTTAKTNTTKTSSVTTINKSYKVVVSGGMNVRASASTSGKIVNGIPCNVTFKVTKKQGNWVYSPTFKGWVCIKSGSTVYCKEISATNVVTYKVTTKLGSNIRAGAGTNYKIIGSLTQGKTFKSEKQSGNWAYSSQLKGWVCIKSGNSTYLTKI